MELILFEKINDGSIDMINLYNLNIDYNIRLKCSNKHNKISDSTSFPLTLIFKKN